VTLLFLITQREDLPQSIERYFRFRGGADVKVIVPPILPKGLARLGKLQWVPETFRKIADAIESHAGQVSGRSSVLLRAVGLIEVPRLGGLDDLDPIDRTKGWNGVVAMLVLAFPEIHWALLSPYDPSQLPDSDKNTIDRDLLRRFHFPQMNTFCDDLETILKFHDEGFTPLFDPIGLRLKIRERMAIRPAADYIPLRKTCAVSIDEEETYSYFHGYAAYRFGYRCHVVTSFGMMNEVLKTRQQDDGNLGKDKIALSFEDIYLNFPDRRTSLSRIEVRDQIFQDLREVPFRIFVTSGHQNTKSEIEIQTDNDRYRESLASKYYNEVLYKPESGVFDIWSRSGMKERLKGSGGTAPDFVWPPGPMDLTNPAGGTHSAPGRLLVIAETLIRRASRVSKNAESVSEALYGATLALEAQEYLGLRTPTTSLDAISLKHRLEVLGECMFYGVEYHLDTESRFSEIEQEMECIGIWFREETRDVSKLNAEIGMLSELVLTYRSFDQFNEEQSGLAQLRHVHRRLWCKRNKWWAWLAWPVRWYVDHLLVSIPRFIGAIVLWLLAFSVLYSWKSHAIVSEAGVEPNFLHGLEDSIIAFFGMQPPHEILQLEQVGWLTVWLTMFIIVTGFAHLGIFISHVYVLMSRR
jgi:hypothetical protein